MRNALSALLGLWTLCLAQAGPHPRLVFSPSYVEPLRQQEVARPQLGRLKGRLSGDLGTITLPGEVLACAAAHLFAPDPGADALRLDLIARSLREETTLGSDPLERALALDWCWGSLSVTARQEYLRRVEESPSLLEESDSPLEFDAFRKKLAHLAVAVAVDETDYRSRTWPDVRQKILRAARDYALTALPNYLAWRGGVPTSSAHGPWEESNTAWLLELGSLAVGKNLWAEHPEAMRWLEHYVVIQDETRPQGRRLLRGDGDCGHPHPAADPSGLLPMTAHLWAARTADPSAVALARDLGGALPRSKGDAVLWSWLDVAFPLDRFAGVQRGQLPKQRNLDGAVVFRGSTSGRDYVIWINCGGGYLRSGQHFDAGHFLIEADGPLLTDAGADVALEAVGAKRGMQRLGDGQANFPFEQFSASTIAHNCLLFEDAARLYTWNGKPFVPRGGQRPIEGGCRDFRTPLEAQKRSTGRLTAYGSRPGASYAALELADAYDARTVSRYTRGFLLLWEKVLLVIDVAVPNGSSVTPVWVAQLPVAPDTQLLDKDLQVRGTSETAGVWRVPAADWVRTTSRSGTLAIRSLLPERRTVSLVGGAGDRERILEGAFAGRSYVGGDADSFERLVAVSTRDNVGNAWFRLGAPTQLGRDFGGANQPLWGRVEIEGQPSNRPQLFVTALVLEPGEQPLSQMRITEEPGGALLFLRSEEHAATVQLRYQDGLSGFVVVEPTEPAWELPTDIAPDGPLPTSP